MVSRKARVISKLSGPQIIVSPQRLLHTFTNQLIESAQKKKMAQRTAWPALREVWPQPLSNILRLSIV